jgi:hypothetical protein
MLFRKLCTHGLPQGLLVATLAVALLAGILAVSPGVVLADGTVVYTGQGFTSDGTTYTLNDERCGLADQTPANDGNTGQFANWNGPGQPYQSGQPYLVWVLTANGPTSATLHLPDQTVTMFRVGGTFKYASQYYSPTVTINVVSATYTGTARGNVQLTVSHGCPPAPPSQGAWCSPGFWGQNKDKGAWSAISALPTDPFNGNVSLTFYGTDLNPAVDLATVLTTTGSTYKGPGDAGTDPRTQPPNALLNPFNATGAYLTDLIPGYTYDPTFFKDDTKCPVDAHGNIKPPQP